MGCQRYPPSSDASNSSEHPYEAYTSCQLWSPPELMSFTEASTAALATSVGRTRGYKAGNGGEVRESTGPEEGTGSMIRKTARGIHFHRNRHPSGSGCPFGVPHCATRSRMARRIGYCSSLGAVALVIVLGWEAVSYAVFFFRIPLANPTAYFVASAVIPS